MRLALHVTQGKMEKAAIIGLMRETALFGSLPDDDLFSLAGLVRERHYPSGETILWEGDPPDWFYIVASGRVKVSKHASTGKELIVAVFPPGNIFGEVAVFDGIPYPASAQALDEVRVLGIRRDDLLGYLSQNPSLALRMINLVGGRLREAHNRLRDLAGERVDQRIASILVMLYEKLGSSLPFTRQEIADMAGTTTETAIRVTTRMKEQNIISTTRGEITILDEPRLRELGTGAEL